MFTHTSYTQRTHQHCQHTFSICVVHDQLQLCIHPCSGDVNRQVQQCWYCLPIQTVYTEDVWNRYKQWLITWSEIWRIGRRCQNLPASMLQQILHTTMPMRCWIVLKQYDTMFKQFSLLWQTAGLSCPTRVCSILAIDCHTNWHGMVKHESISAEEHDMHDFQSTLTEPHNFLPQWHLGTPFSILSFLLTVKWTHPWLSSS